MDIYFETLCSWVVFFVFCFLNSQFVRTRTARISQIGRRSTGGGLCDGGVGARGEPADRKGVAARARRRRGGGAEAARAWDAIGGGRPRCFAAAVAFGLLSPHPRAQRRGPRHRCRCVTCGPVRAGPRAGLQAVCACAPGRLRAPAVPRAAARAAGVCDRVSARARALGVCAGEALLKVMHVLDLGGPSQPAARPDADAGSQVEVPPACSALPPGGLRNAPPGHRRRAPAPVPAGGRGAPDASLAPAQRTGSPSGPSSPSNPSLDWSAFSPSYTFGPSSPSRSFSSFRTNGTTGAEGTKGRDWRDWRDWGD